MKNKNQYLYAIILFFLFVSGATFAHAQTTAFTYQGKLTDNNLAANGTYDMQFRLFDSPNAGTGTQQGATVTNSSVQAVNGIFTVNLDFGAGVFASGANLYLEISVRPAGSQSNHIALAPRQQITSAPYAIQSLNAANATTAVNSTQLGGVTANQYVQTSDARLSDARTPTPGSSNYIQNTPSQQSPANFNLSGNGTADTFNAATQFNIGGNRVLSVAGTNNTFVGLNTATVNTGTNNSFAGNGAGQANTSGFRNSFFGTLAGNKNTTGGYNSFFGVTAGTSNTIGSFNSFFGDGTGFKSTGDNNSFFGYVSGGNNTTGVNNSFFGFNAGNTNSTGSYNSFFGPEAGLSNTTSNANSFFGSAAGRQNSTGVNNAYFGADAGRFGTTGNNNSFFGLGAGYNNLTGGVNTFVGASAGLTNTVGNNNTALGYGADFGANNLTFATVIGSGATVSTNNTIVLGRSPDTVQIPGSLSVAGTFGANIFNAATQYNISGNRILSVGGTNNLFAGNGAGAANTNGQANSFFGFNAGNANTTGSFNAFFGSNAGAANTTAVNNSFFGQGAGFKNTTGQDNTFVGNGAGLNNVGGGGNTFLGSLAGQANSSGSNNTFLGINAGTSNVGSNNNTFIGSNSANSNLTGSGNTFLGANTDGAFLTTNATALGQNAFAGQSNSIILGSINGTNGATADTNVGIGTTTPTTKLYVKDNQSSSLTIDSNSTSGAGITLDNSRNNNGRTWRIYTDNGTNSIGTLHFYGQGATQSGEVLTIGTSTAASAGIGNVLVNGDFYTIGGVTVGKFSTGGSSSVCRDSAGSLSVCSSSLRYKKDLSPFKSGLSLINKLNPITFRWKSDNTPDLGFGAEDVAKVEPLLITRNEKGEVEGVKYDRISAVLVNAVKEQQTQIEELQKLVKQQQTQISSLMRGHRSKAVIRRRRNR